MFLHVIIRKTLLFVNPAGDPYVMYTSHGRAVLQHKFRVLFAELETLYPGEFYAIDSTLPGYNFLALHLGYYSKYSEEVSTSALFVMLYLLSYLQGPGEGGPEGVHPDDIGKDGVWKINFTQREPRQSVDIREHPKLFLLVKDVFEDIMKLAHDNVSQVSIERSSELNAICRLNTTCTHSTRKLKSSAIFFLSKIAHLPTLSATGSST